MVEQGSAECQLIAELMEAGFGFCQTMAMIKVHSGEEGRVEAGVSTVCEAFVKMNPVRTAVLKCPRGSFANLNLNVQLVICLNYFLSHLEVKLARGSVGHCLHGFPNLIHTLLPASMRSTSRCPLAPPV